MCKCSDFRRFLCMNHATKVLLVWGLLRVAPIKLIISGSHGTVTHLAPPLGLVLCIKTDYFKILENLLNKDTSILGLSDTTVFAIYRDI